MRDATINILGGVNTLAMHPSGGKLYGAGGTTLVKVVNTATNVLSGFITSPGNIGGPWGAAFSPDGTRAYVTNAGAAYGTVAVIDATTNAVITGIASAGVRGVAVRPDGGCVYTAHDDTFTPFVGLIDPTNNTLADSIPLANGPREIAEPARHAAPGQIGGVSCAPR